MNKLTHRKTKGTVAELVSDGPPQRSSLRIALSVALSTIFAGLGLHYAEGFLHWREVLVGAAFMVATVAFYTELVAILLREEGSAARFFLVAALKAGFLLLLLFPNGRFGLGSYDASSLVWFLVGVLTLLPAGAIIAWDVTVSERCAEGNPPE